MSDDERADIGLHFCHALADGRYDCYVPRRERRKYQRAPSDPPLRLFGGQIAMGDEPKEASRE